MPDHLGFVAAAYCVVLGPAAGYVLWLRARVARVRAELRDSEPRGGAAGARKPLATD
jgi:hypothetical protein